MKSGLLLTAATAAAVGYGAVRAAAPPADDVHAGVPALSSAVDYGADVRPILARRCFVCHGFDESTRAAGLRLDTRAEATAARRGGAAIVPGDPAASLVWQRLTAADPRDRMPPKGEPVTDAERDVLRRWIEAGAPYDEHWSWQPLHDPDVPVVATERFRAHPIDRFIAAELEAIGLPPAPRAEPAVLLRRLTFDLTGLPPTPADLDGAAGRALTDDVERLLAQPAFGETWGRHWLDLMRYAETHGHEFDYPIHDAWRYRDYVIRAMNADVPYDDFVREHIAGDLLPAPRRNPDDGTNASILATGFWWLAQGTHGPVDVATDTADRIDNQIDVLTKSVLGTTVSCARCHDHKFDAIPTEDYYALAGYLRSSHKQRAYLDPGGRIAARAERLADLTTRRIPLLSAWLAEALEELDAAPWLDAVADVRTGTPKPDERDSDIVLFDFEDGTYDGWTVAGDAFGDGPRTQETVAAYQGPIGGAGRFFVNSHASAPDRDAPAADAPTGSLTSPPFTVERPFLAFLIGGGRHPDRTGVRVLVGETVAASVTGHDANRMRRVTVDLAAHLGATARIEIFDRQAGGWGNIGADDFVLTATPDGAARSVTAVAAERGLDPEQLRRWVDAPPPAVPDVGPSGRVFADFNDERWGAWRTTGAAFGAAPLAGGLPSARAWVDASGVGHSGVDSSKLQGTLRSPTFVIEADTVRVRARGQGGMVRLIIENYTLDEFNALLFEGLRQPVNAPDAWTWLRFDVSRYRGQRAHLECIDDGNGFLSVDEVRFVDEPSATGSGDADERPLRARLAELAERWRTTGLGETNAADLRWLLHHDLLALPARLTRRLAALDAERAELEAGLPRPERATAIVDGSPVDASLLHRGQANDPREIVPRRYLTAFGGDPAPSAPGSGRLALADAILDADDPLPARIMANRVWHHLFGRGLVPTTDDFGVLGGRPSHPELLDHLAVRFADDFDWSVKRLITYIVTSETYRMASTHPDPKAARLDPANERLHRHPVKRLTAEALRDAMLAVSGRLDPTPYGPPVPVHLTEFMTGRGRPGASGPLDGAGRRSVYLEVRRNFLDPMLLAFDAPIPSSPVGARNVSNVPAQALFLMNDPFVHAMAQHWGERVTAKAAAPVDERIDTMFRTALGRPPATAERATAASLIDDPTDPDAWADLAHVLFTVQEFSFLR